MISGPSKRAVTTFVLHACLTGSVAASAAGQALQDPSRLAGLRQVQVRADAVWDEAITMSAGGATPEQFREAIQQTFQESIATADAGPAVAPDAPTTVACHVDTFYDSGLIVYALRTQVEAAGTDGLPVIVWLESSVGSYTVQQLHLMFGLGEQCAESFLAAWRSVNAPGIMR